MNLLKHLTFNKTADAPSDENMTTDERHSTPRFDLFFKKLNSLNETHKKYFLWIIILLSIGLFTLLLFHRNQQLTNLVLQMENKRTVLVREQIGDIRAQLDKLTNSSENSPEAQSTLIKLSDELRSVEKSITTDVAKSTELQKMATDINDHFNNLEKTVSSVGNAKSYLDAKALPFQVVSIDVISQQPFVSVDYAHHMMPLGVGDSLAGWKVVNADYSAVEVEFENTQGQYVKISALENTTSNEDRT